MTTFTNKDYAVIVLGGGTAGVVAAIPAARAGAKTLLVEKTGMLFRDFAGQWWMTLHHPNHSPEERPVLEKASWI